MAKLQHMCLCECDHPLQIKTICLIMIISKLLMQGNKVGALGFEPRISRTRIVNVTVTLYPGIFTPYQAMLWCGAMALYYKAFAINPINKIPIKLKVKERGINHNVFIFEKPSKLIPSSSGNGEAIINPPIKNVSHLKDFR
jgi:hypothetical protein